MNNTKDVKAFYERTVTKSLEAVLKRVQTEGFTSEVYTSLRFLQRDLEALNNAEHFFNAWHEEGEGAQRRKGA